MSQSSDEDSGGAAHRCRSSPPLTKKERLAKGRAKQQLKLEGAHAKIFSLQARVAELEAARDRHQHMLSQSLHKPAAQRAAADAIYGACARTGLSYSTAHALATAASGALANLAAASSYTLVSFPVHQPPGLDLADGPHAEAMVSATADLGTFHHSSSVPETFCIFDADDAAWQTPHKLLDKDFDSQNLAQFGPLPSQASTVLLDRPISHTATDLDAGVTLVGSRCVGNAGRASLACSSDDAFPELLQHEGIGSKDFKSQVVSVLPYEDMPASGPDTAAGCGTATKPNEPSLATSHTGVGSSLTTLSNFNSQNLANTVERLVDGVSSSDNIASCPAGPIKASEPPAMSCSQQASFFAKHDNSKMSSYSEPPQQQCGRVATATQQYEPLHGDGDSNDSGVGLIAGSDTFSPGSEAVASEAADMGNNADDYAITDALSDDPVLFDATADHGVTNGQNLKVFNSHHLAKFAGPLSNDSSPEQPAAPRGEAVASPAPADIISQTQLVLTLESNIEKIVELWGEQGDEHGIMEGVRRHLVEARSKLHAMRSA